MFPGKGQPTLIEAFKRQEQIKLSQTGSMIYKLFHFDFIEHMKRKLTHTNKIYGFQGIFKYIPLWIKVRKFSFVFHKLIAEFLIFSRKLIKRHYAKIVFVKFWEKWFFKKIHKNHSCCRKYISREIFAKRFSLETQVVTLIKVCLEK